MTLAVVFACHSSLPISNAHAAPPSGDRWLPSAAMHFGITVHPWEAEVSSQFCPDCTIPDPLGGEEPLRPAQTGDDNDVTPFVGANLELMTPELPGLGSTRFFFGGEIVGNFGVERKVAREGDPGSITSPIPEASRDTTPFNEENAQGQGAETVASITDRAYGAYLGLAIPFEWLDRELLVKPSIGWLRFEVDIEGLTSDAQCQQFGGGVNRCITTVTGGPGFLRETTLRGGTTETYHAVGAGVDLEMAIGRIGPAGLSLYSTYRFYHVLGDRRIVLRDGPNAVSDTLGTGEVAGRFVFEVDPWLHRLGAGLRFVWLGSDGGR